MRDLLVLAIVFGSVPFILARAWIGVIMWSWIGYMSPHRLAWGIARDFPVAQIVGGATLIALLFSRERLRLPRNSMVVLLILLNIWMAVMLPFAFYPHQAWALAEKTFKIQLMIFVTMMLMNSRERLHWLVWTIAVSLGFYGVKGGIFTILTGGKYMVLGPTGSFITGNTTIGLAIIMIVPLMRYLYLNTKNRWVKLGLLAAMGLSTVAAIGTYSRGAFLAISAMGVFLWWKGRKKLPMALAFILLVPMLLAFMPEQWYAKMHTIDTYKQDASAMGRINAWRFAINLTNHYPITGGGFDTFQPGLFKVYAPEPENYHAAHSIYFNMLGDHGYPGLILFLLVFWLAWRTGNRVVRAVRDRPEHRWAYDMASMTQVSLVGYAVGGAFLSLQYWGLPYHLAAMLVLVEEVLRREGVPGLARGDRRSARIRRAERPTGAVARNEHMR